jgi:hypothetical protein
MVLQTFYCKEPHPLLWTGSRAARLKIILCGIPNPLKCRLISTVRTQLTNVDAGRIRPLDEPRVGDRC